MTEEEKKAIDFFKNQLKDTKTNYTSMYYHVNNLELVLNLIEKQEKIIKEQSYTNKKIRRTLKTVRKERNRQNKIIDKMAEEIYNLGQKQDMRNDNITIWIDKEHILNYFTNKVKEK